jgi:hypothetical protein
VLTPRLVAGRQTRVLNPGGYRWQFRERRLWPKRWPVMLSTGGLLRGLVTGGNHKSRKLVAATGGLGMAH